MTTTSVNYAPKASPELVEKLEALLPKLNRSAARLAHDAMTADDLYSSAVERVLRTCDGTETENIIYLRGLSAMRNEEAGSWRIEAHIVDEPHESNGDEKDLYELADSAGKSPEEILVEKENFESAMRVIKSLPEEHRVILNLVAHGVSQVDIAVKLGVTPAAVSQRLARIQVNLSIAIG